MCVGLGSPTRKSGERAKGMSLEAYDIAPVALRQLHCAFGLFQAGTASVFLIVRHPVWSIRCGASGVEHPVWSTAVTFCGNDKKQQS